MKPNIKPGACAMALHIILAEIGGGFAVEVADTTHGKTAGGANFRGINPKGKVPVQEVAGEVLTEVPTILRFLGDRSANPALAPVGGTTSRARENKVLNLAGTKSLVAFGPLFNAKATDAQKGPARQAVAGKLDWQEARLADGRIFLTGRDFTIADACAFVVTNRANVSGHALARWPDLSGFMARVAARPAGQRVLRAEGLAAPDGRVILPQFWWCFSRRP